ncbi:acetyl xylan esterase AXE1 [Roseimicrobium gellanilyticum]|uniref:Acetyl xylan esterase AXE1 n=1 Tax=Roseimicrobium gellanilyticum TaxID=748857 RepID=A0A366HNR3_9BACT|nr:acetylxylan esterase [Roseimicrobium gellanilyticum]RBP45150.1 acetyl xylan esterase AXE1 [Roseimicrobium gellanilyticum]
MRIRFLLLAAALLSQPSSGVLAQFDTEQGNSQLDALRGNFKTEVGRLEGQLAREIKTKEDWLLKKDEYRRQLAEMLGLDPMPLRTDLKATKTGEFEHEGIIVENLHYQSMPGLYVTANLYRPKQVEKPLPAVLYVCGHSSKMKDGISYGNKTGYEHHGVWYAKHGFVCLVIDTVQLGEIRGEHHGTYSKGRWWWMARGYTPAGVEAWAGIRALDYLESRPEVDKTRFGVTGRSGGGAYSWWVAALDERIKAAAPTAGITTLRNHVVDGCVEGHCDCMFMVNTYQWDYETVAALVAPRPLCIVNTDKDRIFPIDGVFNIYQNVRRIYKLLDAEKNIGLQFAEGPHMDTQPLNVGEFHWMTRFLQGAELMSTLDSPAVKGIPMEKLRVFTELPKDERNTKIDETFVAKAPAPANSENADQWKEWRERSMNALREKVFRSWPVPREEQKAPSLTLQKMNEADGVVMTVVDEAWSDLLLRRNQGAKLPVYLAHRAGLGHKDLELVVLNVLDEQGWTEFVSTYGSKFPECFPSGMPPQSDAKAFEQEKKMFQNFKWGMAYVCPRGIGPTAWDKSVDGSSAKEKASADKARAQRLRRFYLLGQTLEGQQTWDILCAIRAVRSFSGLENTKLWLQASRLQAGNAVYASLFENGITRLDLHEVPRSHAEGPIYLNVLKYLDMPQAVAMASERTRVIVYDDDKEAWSYPQQVSDKLEWGKEKKAGFSRRDVPKMAAE